MNTSIAGHIAYQPTRGRLAPIRTPMPNWQNRGQGPGLGPRSKGFEKYGKRRKIRNTCNN